MFDAFNIAVALCDGAHLASLKSYSSKFISHLTTRRDAESGLRVPSMVEAQHADQKIQQLVAELVVERSWSLDQALHEVTNIRPDLAVLLQPRPKAAKLPTWNPDRSSPAKGKSYDKGFGKKGKDKGRGKGGKKGKGKNTWVTEMQVNGEWKPLCLKYQLGQCNYPTANTYINVHSLDQMEQHVGPSIRHRNTAPCHTDSCRAKISVSPKRSRPHQPAWRFKTRRIIHHRPSIHCQQLRIRIRTIKSCSNLHMMYHQLQIQSMTNQSQKIYFQTFPMRILTFPTSRIRFLIHPIP